MHHMHQKVLSENLDSFHGEERILRAGRGLHHASLDQKEKTPVITPGWHHVAALLLSTMSISTTDADASLKGYMFRWIVSGKKRISNMCNL